MHDLGPVQEIAFRMQNAATGFHPLGAPGVYLTNISKTICMFVCAIEKISHDLDASVRVGWQFFSWGWDRAEMVQKYKRAYGTNHRYR
jgi:hypothetical protein